MPHFGTFCIHRTNWDKLVVVMRGFGCKNGLELHGGIDTSKPGQPLFNAYLARGYSYWWGDDLDLWMVSNPFVEGEMTYNGMTKKPWTKADRQSARGLLAATANLQCRSRRS